MLRRKPLLTLLAGAAAVGAGIIGLRARRERGPEAILPSSPMPPTPAEPAGEAPRLPKPEPVSDPRPQVTQVAKSKPGKPVAQPEPAKQVPAKPRASAGSKARSKPAAGSRAKPKSSPAAGGTREELYREAKRLGIEGRSKMSKAELERAIAKASRN